MNQTPVSQRTLVETGRGDLLEKHAEKHAKSDGNATATDKVLMQVASFLRHELPIRLAHRARDLTNVPMMKVSFFCLVSQGLGFLQYQTIYNSIVQQLNGGSILCKLNSF